MKKSLIFALMCAAAVSFAAPAMADPAAPAKGQMLHDADGGRLAPVYKVNDDGSVQIIIYGKLVTIPANTLSSSGGDLKTSLTKNQVIAIQ